MKIASRIKVTRRRSHFCARQKGLRFKFKRCPRVICSALARLSIVVLVASWPTIGYASSAGCTAANANAFNITGHNYTITNTPPTFSNVTFSQGEKITSVFTITNVVGSGDNVAIFLRGPTLTVGKRFSTAGTHVDTVGVPSSGNYEFQYGGTRFFGNSLALNVTTTCLAATNPFDRSTLTIYSETTGTAGIEALTIGHRANVNSRFFGGTFHTADAGPFFQLADAYRMSGLDRAPQTNVAVTPGRRLRWSIWMKGNTTWLASSNPGGNFDGHLNSLTGGVDYLVTDNLLIGALVGYENFDLDTAFNNGAFKGKGLSVGPYVGVRILRRFVFDALFAYTWLDSNVTGTSGTTTATGGYTSNRWLGAANFTGHWRVKRVRLSPALGVIYAEEDHNTFTNSIGQTTAAARTKLGRFSAGPEVGVTVYRRGTSYLEPYVFFKGQYDFESQGTVVLPSGAVVAAQEKLSGRLGFGLNARFGKVLTARLGGFYDGIGRTNFESWTAEARLRLRW